MPNSAEKGPFWTDLRRVHAEMERGINALALKRRPSALDATFAALDLIVATHWHRTLSRAPLPASVKCMLQSEERVRACGGLSAAERNRSSLDHAALVRMGSIAGHRPQVEAYHRAAASTRVRCVCEVGFNGGHSTALWLLANPTAVVHNFDLFNTPFATPCADFLMARFPGRLFVHRGDSMATIPAFAAARRPIPCDLVHVDGKHSYANTLSDTLHLLPAVSPEATVVFDDQCDPASCTGAGAANGVAIQPTLAACDLLLARVLVRTASVYGGALRQFAFFRLNATTLARRASSGPPPPSRHVKLPCARDAPLCELRCPSGQPCPSRNAAMRDYLVRKQMFYRESACDAE